MMRPFSPFLQRPLRTLRQVCRAKQSKDLPPSLPCGACKFTDLCEHIEAQDGANVRRQALPPARPNKRNRLH